MQRQKAQRDAYKRQLQELDRQARRTGEEGHVEDKHAAAAAAATAATDESSGRQPRSRWRQWIGL
jgi:hypothetical protein